MLNKYDRKMSLLREELKKFNLGSRCYVQTDQTLTNKIACCKRKDYNRPKQKLLRIMEKKNQHVTKRITKEYQDRIQEAKEICNRKLVYNLSDKQIRKETEDLFGRLGLNFQFTLRKFPTIEVVQATELCRQKIEQ